MVQHIPNFPYSPKHQFYFLELNTKNQFQKDIIYELTLCPLPPRFSSSTHITFLLTDNTKIFFPLPSSSTKKITFYATTTFFFFSLVTIPLLHHLLYTTCYAPLPQGVPKRKVAITSPHTPLLSEYHLRVHH